MFSKMLEVDRLFVPAEELKSCVEDWSTAESYVCVDKTTQGLIIAVGCNWRVHATPKKDTTDWEVRKDEPLIIDASSTANMQVCCTDSDRSARHIASCKY